MPITGKLVGAETPNESALSRVNAIREETGGSHRWFLPVVSGPIYIYDKKTKAFATYLDFNGHGENRGLFKKFFTLSGFGNGINGFNLDPDYTKNGKFYTTHMEDPSIEASGVPQNTMFPRLNTSGYTDTRADHDARSGDASGRADRMDRHRSVEQHLRRHGARGVSRVAQHAQSSARRDGVQSDRPARRSRLARAVCRRRRRRIRRIAGTWRSGRTRSGSTPWSARSCASFPI